MGMNSPNDPKIELARAQEKLKNSAQLRREIERLSSALETITREHNDLQVKLAIEKKISEYLQIALTESKNKLEHRNKHRHKLSIVTNIFFLISNLLTAWGVNVLTSTPPNNTGYVFIGAGIFIFIVNVISSEFLALGDDD